MKKIICLLLALCFVLSLCACDAEEVKETVSQGVDAIKDTVAEHSDDIAAIGDKAKESLSELTDLLDEKAQDAKEFIANNTELKEKVEEASSMLSDKFTDTFVNVIGSLDIDADSANLTESDSLSPEFVACMADYEEFYELYCAFYTDYAERNGTAVAADAAKALAKYSEVKKDLGKLEDHTFTTAEKKYLSEAQARVEQKLADTRALLKSASDN